MKVRAVVVTKTFGTRGAVWLLTAIFSLCAIAALADEPTRGPVTNLPLPRFVSMKTDTGNVRRGPSLTHRRYATRVCWGACLQARSYCLSLTVLAITTFVAEVRAA